MARLGPSLDPEALAEIAERHGCDIDMDATGPVIARHHLVF
jgi:hypothetical protein